MRRSFPSLDVPFAVKYHLIHSFFQAFQTLYATRASVHTSASGFVPPSPQSILAPTPTYLGMLHEMRPSLKDAHAYPESAWKGKRCQPQRHQHQTRSRATSKRGHRETKVGPDSQFLLQKGNPSRHYTLQDPLNPSLPHRAAAIQPH